MERISNYYHPEFLQGATLLATKSGYNNEVSIWQKGTEKYVLRKPREFKGLDSNISNLSPFIGPNKLDKEFEILNFLKTANLPIAECVYHEPNSLSVYDWAIGEELDFKDPKFTHEQRKLLGFNLGKFLAKFHRSQEALEGESLIQNLKDKHGFKDTKSKHIYRLNESIFYLLENKVFSPQESIEVANFGVKNINNIPQMPFRLIHGDVYSRNVFINPDSFEISTVIDWIDASEVDDPLADLLLTARWFAFDDYLSDAENENSIYDFNNVISGYASVLKVPLKHSPLNLYKFYDLLWHLRVLVAENVKGNFQAINQYKQTLKSLIK